MRKQHRLRVLIVFALTLALFLQGCQMFYKPDVPSPEPEVQPEPEDIPPDDPPVSVTHRPGRFTLRYNSNSSINPITTLNSDNILISSLMYESLFVLDGDLNVEPLLCESWESLDNVTFTFLVKSNISMHDGSHMTADDVVYSLRQAMQRGRYVHRFTSVSRVTSDGELTVTIELVAPNSQFVKLLDFPIIKNGTIEQRVPPGTGPYVLVGTEYPRLERYPGYRSYQQLPLSLIRLIECADDELTQLFDDGEISFLWDDPSDAFEIRINRLFDLKYYETTTLQFIGFNGRSGIMRDPDVRRAIGCAIERDYIVSELMPLGHAVAAPLPLSPSYRFYNPQWEQRDMDPFEEMALRLDSAGLKDFDNDSFLEVSDGFGGYHEFTVSFIVNSENIYRVRIVQRIADTLRQVGFDITVRELSWDRYIAALEAGNFDMYYGEVMLGADFDLSPLLLPGRLNYGGTANTSFRPFIEEFLIARDEDEVNYAVGRLLYEITRLAPFVPVLYKRYAIYSPMGAITGAAPGQTNVFRNITDWTVNLTMLS